MSSFKKATKASDGNKLANEGRMNGVKPWVNGLSLVSSGIRELDDILGGGHVLGSTCLMHEDSYSNHAETVLLYSLAEAISQKHKTLLIVRDTHEAKAILSSLPFNMNKGSLSLDKKKTDMKTSEEEEDDKKRHLKIAWQYGKYIQDPASSPSRGGGSSRSSSSYCSSYDLANRLQPEVFAENMPRVYCYAEKREIKPSTSGLFDFQFDSPDASSETSNDVELAAVLNGIHDAVFNFREVHSHTQANPLRVFLPHYDAVLSSALGTSTREGTAGLSERGELLGAQLLLRLKHLLQHDNFPGTVPDMPTETSDTSSPEIKIAAASVSSKVHIRMTVFVTVLPAALPETISASRSSCLLQTLNSLADTVLGVESFAGHADAVPIEFRFFCGFFFVHKLQQIAVMAPHRASAYRFGLKRDRRKLHIEPLHLPPEDSRASKYQSETSLGVKQQTTEDPGGPRGGVGRGREAGSTVVSSSSTALGGQSRSSNSVMSGNQSSASGTVTRSIQKISIHGNDSSRHAPALSSSTTKALCASSLSSVSTNLKNKNPKNLDF